MSFISVFDVMGPNMIGPSSSHTAGAARIGFLARKMIHGPLKKVDFTLYGSFSRTYKGHGTDRALLGGIMGFSTDDMRIRNSFEIAEKKRLEFTFTPNEVETDLHPNTVDIHMVNEKGQVIHQDKPGVIAYITKCLSDRNVNIAFMRLFRESKGEIAYTIVESDGQLPEDIGDTIRQNINIHEVMIVQM